MISDRRSAHDQSKTTAYVEVQRRRLLNTISVDANIDQRKIDLNVSKSKLSFLFTIFIFFFFLILRFLMTKAFRLLESRLKKSMQKKKCLDLRNEKLFIKSMCTFYDNLYDSFLSFYTIY